MATSLRRHRRLCVHNFILLCLFCSLASARLRGQLSPVEEARRERERRQAERCAPANQELCGEGEGVLVCEYEDKHGGYYATRCVNKNFFAKHVALHPKNYCGSCHKCFQNTDELKYAVRKYMQNGTQNTNIARIYGWPIGEWCVDSVSDFSHLFSGQNNFNEDIGAWDVRRATNMGSMFLDAFQFDQDLSDWSVGQVTDMSLMFDRAYVFEGNGLAAWDTSKVTSFQRTFRIAKNFQEDISVWDTAKATDMSLMFYRAELFNQPLNDWNVARVTDLSYTFAFAKEFNQTLAQWQTQSATTVRGMFQGAESFVQDLTGWNVAHVTDMSFIFSNARAFHEAMDEEALLEAWNWNLKSVEYKNEMFGGVSPLNQTVSALTDLHNSSPTPAAESY